MKHQNYGPRLGKLVHQLPRDVTLAYDIRFTCSIPRQKYISEYYNFWCVQRQSNFQFSPDFPKKRHLGPQNDSQSSRPKKLLKIVSCDETEKLKEPMARVQME